MTRTVITPGTVIGPYEVQALIGRGGMGDVYRAVREDINRTVALKVLAPGLAAQDSFAARFVREARTLGSLEHPGIATVYDAGQDGHQLYLAMRLVGSGSTLKTLLEEGRPPTDRALRIVRQVAEAVDHAHANAVIHRDIKSANILLDDDGRPILADFGLARALDDTSTTLSSDYLGTPIYLAPEQASRKSVGHRSDLYSLGCLAFELITDRAPYVEPDAVALMLAHAGQPVPRASDVAPDLRTRINQPYTATMTFTVSPAAQVRFDLGLRWSRPGTLAYLLRTDTTEGTITLQLFKDGTLTPLAPPAPVKDLDSGRDVTVAVEVGGSSLALWVDGQRVAAVQDAQAPETAGTIPGLDVFGNPGTGTVRVKELVYQNWS